MDDLSRRSSILPTMNILLGFPLHYAASAGHLSVVRLLLFKGADMGLINEKGETPTYLAFKAKHYITAGFMALYPIFNLCRR